MHRRRLLAVSGALAAGAFAGCISEGNPTPGGVATTELTPTASDTATRSRTRTGSSPTIPPPGVVSDESLADLVTGANALAFDLHREMIADRSGENILSSPLSVTVALAMTYAGAKGETREQMREALNYSLAGDTLHDAFAALQRTVNDRGDEVDESDLKKYAPEDDPVPFQLNLVNALWGQEGYPFRDGYLSLVESHYGGGLREVDYAADPEVARAEINDWVADRTEGRITDLLPDGSIDGFTRLVLTNAVYFFANWRFPFEKGNTEAKAFTAIDGSTGEVPMMSQARTFRHATVDGAKAVDLPYLGGDISMLLILPPEGEFEEYERSLDRVRFAELVDALESDHGKVALPRFEFASEFDLRAALEALGMRVAFDGDRADFTGMVPPEKNLFIDQVYHDTYVSVDETGTEASAATAAVLKTVVSTPEPFKFVADRPFLFAIRDRPTGTVLFLGRVVDAGAAQ